MSNLEKINVLTKDKLDSLDLTQYPNQIFGTTDEVAEGGGSGASVVVDSELSKTSENPVQNKVITNAIAGVERIETIYDINNGKTTLGTTDYGSGIQGGVEARGCDFSKYKQLIIYCKLGYSTMVYRIDLTFPNADISTNVLSGYAYCGGGSLANIDNGAGTSKSSCLISSDLTKFKHHLIGWSTGTTWNDRAGRGDWFIYKMEGVLK